MEPGSCINISHIYRSKPVEAQCEIIAEEITSSFPKNIDLITTALTNNAKKRLPSTTSTTEVLRSSLRFRHTKNARLKSTDLEDELTPGENVQHIQDNITQKEPTQPTFGQILPAQSFTLPIEHDPALHVELPSDLKISRKSCS